MLAHLRRSVVFVVLSTALVFVFAFAGTGLSQLLFHHQANGSLTPNGSTLIGQDWSNFNCPNGALAGSCVFQGRPDANGGCTAGGKFCTTYGATICQASDKNCTPVAGGDNPLYAYPADQDCTSPQFICAEGQSGATNLGPRSNTLVGNTELLIGWYQARGVPDPTPDLVTTSGSGYDPDINPADALVQVPMVSKATGIPAARLVQLVHQHTRSQQLGFLGSGYVNVLELNQGLFALDHITSSS